MHKKSLIILFSISALVLMSQLSFAQSSANNNNNNANSNNNNANNNNNNANNNNNNNNANNNNNNASSRTATVVYKDQFLLNDGTQQYGLNYEVTQLPNKTFKVKLKDNGGNVDSFNIARWDGNVFEFQYYMVDKVCSLAALNTPCTNSSAAMFKVRISDKAEDIFNTVKLNSYLSPDTLGVGPVAGTLEYKQKVLVIKQQFQDPKKCGCLARKHARTPNAQGVLGSKQEKDECQKENNIIINGNKTLKTTYYPVEKREVLLKQSPNVQDRHFEGNIDSINIQIENGFIEKIQLFITFNDGQLKRSHLEFSNLFAIGFSTPSDYKKLPSIAIWDKYYGKYFIYLGDAIKYIPRIKKLTRNYSPHEQTTPIRPLNDGQLVFRKELERDLFDARQYTDFAGFPKTRNNPIIQLEIQRQFNLNTKRKQVKSSFNSGILNYITPRILFAKFEKDRTLILHSANKIVNNKVLSVPHATTLDVYNYQNFAFTVQPNLFYFDLPEGKFSLVLDVPLTFGYTPAYDSVRSVSVNDDGRKIVTATAQTERIDLNHFQLTHRLNLKFLDEYRFGFEVAGQTTWMRVFSNEMLQVPTYDNQTFEKIDFVRKAEWFNTYEFYAFARLSAKGRIFVRYRFNHQLGEVNTNFHQAQLGFSINVTSKVSF